MTLLLSKTLITRENSKLSAELDKDFIRKGLGKNIIKVNISIFDVFINKIIIYIYVLSLRVEHKIIS